MGKNTPQRMAGGETLDVASGSSSKIRLRPIRNRMISSTERRCSEQPLETVRYVSSFSNGSRNVRTKEYTKSVADYVFEAKQRVIQHSCGCLSHHYPFPNNTSQLCYFVPYQFWKSPPGAALNKIKCHDEWFSKVEKLSSQLANEFRHRRWCEYFRQRPSHMSSSWPPFESVVEIWDQIIVPHVVDGIEFLPNDGKEHHIYSQMEDSRQAMMFGTLILNERACLELFCVINITFNGLPAFFCTMPVHQLERSSYCVRRDSLANNLAAVRISLEGSTADAYEEETGFDWTEALSEVGGTLGLWLGVSIVSALELVELVYILVKNFLNSERRSAPETSLIETSRNPDTDHGVQTTANGLPQCKERQLRIYTGVSLLTARANISCAVSDPTL